jgi:glycosyltransferase involved in cell wall biosynthesis
MAHLALFIPANIHIYDTHDDWRFIEGNNFATVEREENLLAKQIDFAVAASEFLKERFIAKSVKVYSLPNACDYKFWQKVSKPHPALESLSKPRFIYYGGFQCFDFPAVIRAAREIPNASFVFLGKKDHSGIAQLEKEPNIYFFSEQPYNSLPNWIAGTDVCILPFLVNEWTRSRDCIKLYEYLATGKPVVINQLAQVNRFPELLYVNYENTAYGFSQLCKKALNENDQEKTEARKAVAFENDWNKRIKKLLELISG